VTIKSDADVVAARSMGRSLAEHRGFGMTDVTMIATAISELARNILKYAHEGEIVVESVERDSRAGVSVAARTDRKSTRLNSSHQPQSRMPSSA